jgi:hypothetical protein
MEGSGAEHSTGILHPAKNPRTKPFQNETPFKDRNEIPLIRMYNEEVRLRGLKRNSRVWGGLVVVGILLGLFQNCSEGFQSALSYNETSASSGGNDTPPPNGEPATPEPPVTQEPPVVGEPPVVVDPPPVALCAEARPLTGTIKDILVTPSQPVRVPDFFMGMHVGLHQPSWLENIGGQPIPSPKYPFDYVRTLRADVDGKEESGFWNNIETSPGVYDWRSMDKWMAAHEGHPVVWLVYGTPTFYQKYPGEPTRWGSWPGIASPPTDAGHLALKKYVQAAVARYKTQIAAIEIWNEPTLPWTGGVTSYNDRWTKSWGEANAPSSPTPFFSGSASDLANIAYTIKSANPGVPILGAAFVDQWQSDRHTVTRFLNAPVTLPGGHGTGKDHIDALSIHFYDYSFDPTALISHVDGYRSKLDAVGLENMPIWGTETGAEDRGVFVQNDARAPIFIQRWVLLAAAKRLQSMILYGHVGKTDALKFLGDPIYNQAVIDALKKAAVIRGQLICNAAVLADGRVWLTTLKGDRFEL